MSHQGEIRKGLLEDIVLEMELDGFVICGCINSTGACARTLQGPGAWEVHKASVTPACVVTI